MKLVKEELFLLYNFCIYFFVVVFSEKNSKCPSLGLLIILFIKNIIMDSFKFKSLLNDVHFLGTLQFRKLREEIDIRVKSKKISNILETPIKELTCPHCNSNKFIRWGKRNDLQRYKCKTCNKTFNSLTKTPLARLKRKGHWLDYSNCLKNELSIRKAALVCGIHKNTSFRWRHRFIYNSKNIKAKKLSGIIESGETIFKESFKGEKNIPINKLKSRKDIFVIYNIDRNNNVFDITNKGFNSTILKSNLETVIHQGSLIISEKKEVYKTFASKSLLKLSTVHKEKKHVVSNIDKIESFREKFQKWIMNHFRGVATKYLENYVSWYRGLNEFKSGINSLTILYRAKSIEKYRHQPQKVTNYVL